AILAVALGVRQVMGLYLVPMTIEHGWSREAFGLAMAIQNLMWGLMQPFVGGLADRYGSGRVIAAGAALYALGVWGMAGAATAGGLGPFVFPQVTGTRIGGFGWQGALLASAAIAALMIPLGALMRGWSADEAGAVPQSWGAALGEACRHPGFLLLVAGFFVC